jgi:SAM-dependent methyltransferase
MDDSVYREMFDLEDRHWWFVAKRAIVAKLLARYLPAAGGVRPRVADIGCGCGATIAMLNGTYDVVGVDSAEQAREFCGRRGLRVEIGRLPHEVPLAPGTFDAVLVLDVLEHIDDDVNSARACAALLKPGGVMIATSPAYKWLWGFWDEVHHHKRRYTLGEFRSLMDRGSGLRVEMASYMNTLLFPLAATARVAQKVFTPKNRDATLRIRSRAANAFFRTTFASERHLLGKVKLPFGLSVVTVARRGDGDLVPVEAEARELVGAASVG